MDKKNPVSRERLRYSKITPYIYIGTNMFRASHFEKLRKLGISVDIDLESERLEKIPTRGLDTFLWLPTENGHAPTHNQMAAGVAFLDQMVRHKKKVYVHCKNGHGRAPTLVVAYLVTHGMMPDRAIAFVKKKRAVVHLNRIQVAAVRRFAKLSSTHERSRRGYKK